MEAVVTKWELAPSASGPWSTMRGMKALMVCTAPIVLVPSSHCQSLTGSCQMQPTEMTPALENT